MPASSSVPSNAHPSRWSRGIPSVRRPSTSTSTVMGSGSASVVVASNRPAATAADTRSWATARGEALGIADAAFDEGGEDRSAVHRVRRRICRCERLHAGAKRGHVEPRGLAPVAGVEQAHQVRREVVDPAECLGHEVPRGDEGQLGVGHPVHRSVGAEPGVEGHRVLDRRGIQQPARRGARGGHAIGTVGRRWARMHE